MGRAAAGVKAIRLKAKDQVIGMIVVGPEEKFVFTASERGYGKKTAEVRPLSRATQGVRIISLEAKDRVSAIAKVIES